MCVRLNKLELSNIRNLRTVSLDLGGRFNVFTGANGSGKTSLLEAVHLLGLGRSFRAKSMQQIISFGDNQCLVRAKLAASGTQLQDTWLAIEPAVGRSAQYRIGENSEKSAAAITKILPMQLIDVNSHVLLEGGPSYRRQLIDWGVFHVEHSFLQAWRLLQRAMKQRNAALYLRQMPAEIWDETFVKYADIVDCARASYVQRFAQIFSNLLAEMLGWMDLTVRYNRGWPTNQDLKEVLARSSSRDLGCGYTTAGPHRAEVEFLLNNKPAREVLSRGQIKIFVCIMLLARIYLLPYKQSIFLIDDLHAEFDKKNCKLFIHALEKMECQVFITGIEADLLRERLFGCDAKMFHVEQGSINECVA